MAFNLSIGHAMDDLAYKCSTILSRVCWYGHVPLDKKLGYSWHLSHMESVSSRAEIGIKSAGSEIGYKWKRSSHKIYAVLDLVNEKLGADTMRFWSAARDANIESSVFVLYVDLAKVDEVLSLLGAPTKPAAKPSTPTVALSA